MGINVLYLPHGGGPIPLLGGYGHEKLIEFFKGLGDSIDRPDHILVISAHWEEDVPTLISAPDPSLLYDYYGFPEESYNISYPVKGDEKLASEINRTFIQNSIDSKLQSDRGLDHGVFVPLKLIFPKADIPVTQLSLKKSLNPTEHLNIGRVLGEVLQPNTLVIGSGFSFHNMQHFSMEGTTEDNKNDQFQDWLINTCCRVENQEERLSLLTHWEEAPYARYCHPREEHLLPLHVCAGITDNKGDLIFDDYVAGKRAIGIKWLFRKVY